MKLSVPTWRVVVPTLAAAFSCAFAAPASADVQWLNGVDVFTNIFACGIGNAETGAYAHVGFLADPNAPPHVGDVYYGHTVLGAVGLTCADNSSQGAHFEVQLPRSTQFAVSAQNPIKCFVTTVDQAPQPDTSDCPTGASAGYFGGTALNPPGNDAYTIDRGVELDIQFPLVSSAQLLGDSHPGGCDCLVGLTKVADGQGDPLLQLTKAVVVQPGAGPAPGPPPQPVPPPQPPQPLPQPSDLAGAHAPHSIRLAQALRKGITVTLVNAYPGTTDRIVVIGSTGKVKKLSEARKKIKVFGKATRRGQHKGKVKLRVRLSRTVRSLLEHHRTTHLLITVTASSSGHPTGTASRKLTLKR
jgi:hypothetical protein